MRLFLKKKTPDRIEFGVIYGGIALLFLAVGRFLPVLSWAPDCVFRGLTGAPCPTCGATRSVVHLSHGNILSALALNPLTTLFLVLTAVYFFISLVSVVLDLPRISILLTEQEQNLARAGVVTLLLAQWAYLVILL